MTSTMALSSKRVHLLEAGVRLSIVQLAIIAERQLAKITLTEFELNLLTSIHKHLHDKEEAVTGHYVTGMEDDYGYLLYAELLAIFPVPSKIVGKLITVSCTNEELVILTQL